MQNLWKIETNEKVDLSLLQNTENIKSNDTSSNNLQFLLDDSSLLNTEEEL